MSEAESMILLSLGKSTGLDTACIEDVLIAAMNELHAREKERRRVFAAGSRRWTIGTTGCDPAN